MASLEDANKKICTACNQEKDIEDFSFKNKKKNIRQSKCKLCMSKVIKEQYYKNPKAYRLRNDNRKANIRKRLYNYLSTHPCVDCGESDPACLDFDHVKEGKTQNVGGMTSNSWERVEREISLCEVRCANCHRRKTAKQQGWYNKILSS